MNSVLNVNPNALANARALDAERRRRGPRGPLHGIPVLLKDNFDTMDMPTTGGALAFEHLVPPYEATLTANLRAARLTILYGASGCGKTSVLQAGVVHDLREQVRANATGRTERTQRMPFAVCAFGAWHDDPLAALAEAMRTAAVEALGGLVSPYHRPDADS